MRWTRKSEDKEVGGKDSNQPNGEEEEDGRN